MGEFPIERAPEKLGITPTTAVRADLDVRTGGRELARAVSGLGEALFGVGLRSYLMEADTQLDKARMQADEEHTRYMLGLQAIEDTSDKAGLYNKAFKETMATREKFMPTNRVAAREYKSYLTRNTAQWGRETILAKRAKREDNFRAVGFEKQTKAIQSGQFLDYFTHLAKGVKTGAYDAEEVEKLKQVTRESHQQYLAITKREAAEQLKLAQEQTNRQLLADLWDGKLRSSQVITDAVRNNLISAENGKYLRKELLSPEPTTLKLENLANVKDAINDIGTGAKTREQALDVLYTNLDGIDPTTGKSLLNEIYGEHDKGNAEIKREAKSIMEEIIRDRNPYTGLWTDDERQILGSAEALLMLSSEIEKAAKAGKPLERRDILIKAVQIGRQIKRKIKQEEEEKTEPSFIPIPTKGAALAPREPEITKEGKPIVKGAAREPKFEMRGGEPEKVFDDKGREMGLRMQTGTIFRIGYHAIIGGRKYEYMGNGDWKLIK
jgi:hypothetical protein